MATNDFFSTRERTAKPKGKPGQGRSSTVISITSEVSDIAESREKALSQIAGQIAMYAINAAQGNIDVSNTQVARSNLDAILKAARLNDADAKNVLMEAIVKITMNA